MINLRWRKYFIATCLITISHCTLAGESSPLFSSDTQQPYPQQRNQNRGPTSASAERSPALYYNLGVTEYQQGNYNLAREAFSNIEETASIAPQAYYNVALSYLRQDAPDEAIEWLIRSKRVSTDREFIQILDSVIDELKNSPDPDPNQGLLGFLQNKTKTNLFVTTQYGVKTNSYVDRSQAPSEPAQFQRSSADIQIRSGKSLFRLTGGNRNPGLNLYTSDSHYFAILQHSIKMFDINNQISSSYDRDLISGHALFKRTAAFSTTPFERTHSRTTATIQYSQFTTESEKLKPLAGNNYTAQLGQHFFNYKHRFSASLQIDDTTRNGYSHLGEKLISLSGRQLTFSISIDSSITSRVQYMGNTYFSTLAYKDPEYLGSSRWKTRYDELVNIENSLSYSINNYMQLTAGHIFHQLKPNIDKYWMQSNTYQASISVSY